MSINQLISTGDRADHETPVSKGTIFEILRNPRRRRVIHYLKQRGDPMTIGELAESIAAWENHKGVGQITSTERKRVYTSLKQVHLPKMKQTGVIDYDHNRGWIELSDTADDFEFYLEVVPGQSIPWSEYYLGLAATASTIVALLWTNIYPFTLVSDLLWVSFITATFLVSSLAHYVAMSRSRLGHDEPAPETPVEGGEQE